MSATEILRHAQSCVASQRLHEAFASFCQARDILSADQTTATSKRVLAQVHNEVDRMAAYLKSDPYTCLGVAPSASDKVIKKAYRSMARTYHPDKNKHTQQLFILVKDAYELLSNPSERAKLRSSSKGTGRHGHNNTSSASSSSSSSSNMSAEEMFRRRRQKEAKDLAERKRRHMEMKRKKEAAAKRRRDAKAAAARKQREALLQQQMQEQIKRAWQFVQQQAENDQGVSLHNNDNDAISGNSQSIGSKLDSIRQRVLEKMNEIRERAGDQKEQQKDHHPDDDKQQQRQQRQQEKEKEKEKKVKKEKEEKKARDKIWKEGRRQRNWRKVRRRGREQR